MESRIDSARSIVGVNSAQFGKGSYRNLVKEGSKLKRITHGRALKMDTAYVISSLNGDNLSILTEPLTGRGRRRIGIILLFSDNVGFEVGEQGKPGKTGRGMPFQIAHKIGGNVERDNGAFTGGSVGMAKHAINSSTLKLGVYTGN